jgi:TolB protein
MGKRFGQAGHLWSLLLLPVQLLRHLGQTRPGQWLTRAASFVLGPPWRFLGRMGLALRRLLTLFIWRPFHFLTYPFYYFLRQFWRALWPYLRPLVHFWGRVGLALRKLLTWLIWRPLWWLSTPLRRLLGRLGAWLRAALARRWAETAPQRRIWRQRMASRWLIVRARLRVIRQRPSRPKNALIVPSAPRQITPNVRALRYATVLLSLIAILVLGFIALQDQTPLQVAASGDGSFVPRVVIVTPTPEPATPTPDPTPEIQITPWPTPDPLTGGGTLAFTLDQNGRSDIYLLPIGQPEPIRLTYHEAPDRQPVWRPDGQALAFSSKRSGNWDIYVYDFARGQLRQITDHAGYDGAPAWSPDGQWLVYESYRADNMDIYIVKADLSEGPYRLTQHASLDYAPAWSPNGRHIAFTSWRSGTPDIYLLSLDELSDEAAINLTQSPARRQDGAVWSPDGRYLAYHEESDDLALLYTLPIGENMRPSGSPVSLGQQGQQPAWSPNGQSLVYVHQRDGRYFLLAASRDVWGVAPQTFVSEGRLADPTWTAVSLPPDLIANLRPIDSPRADVPLFVEALAQANAAAEDEEGTEDDPDAAPYQLFELPVSAPSPYLNDRVDQSFLALRQRVQAEAGWDFLGQLDHMFHPLTQKPLPGQPSQSWNQAGRAFDITYQEALAFEPRIEVVREVIGPETYWRVYVRTEAQDGSLGEPLRQRPWDFRARFGAEPRYYDEGGRLKDEIPAGYYLDLTALAADYGWERIPAMSNWRTYFPGIRFWHFVNTQGLTWPEAMAEIYTGAELERAGINE